MNIGGVTGKILNVDLSSGRIETEDIQEKDYLQWLGGYGLGAYLLYQRQAAHSDPLGPENILELTTGPLTGTRAITGNRFTAVGKSPKTHTWGDANCGGNFGPGLKESGFDSVFFKGIAEKPVYLLIENGKSRIVDATEIWGCDSNETEDKLKDKHGKQARVACIGPAGEGVSLLACIMNDYGRAAGRSGLGAIMGAKKLKAVVAVGDQAVSVADKEKVLEIRKKCLENFKTNESYDNLHKYGTAGITADACTTADTPIRNWGGTPEDFPNPDKISDDNVIRYLVKPYGCWGCSIACGGHVKVKEGRYAGEAHKPEYETLGVFGTLCLNDNVESIIKLNDICNRAGLDTISTGATIAFALECFEKGILTRADTGGLDLRWGNDEAIVALTELIAKNEGAGKLLYHGMKNASEKLGTERCRDYAMHVAGEELPMHDSRLNPGLATSYQVDATPGRHTQMGAWFYESDFFPTGADKLFKTYEDKHIYTGKAEAAKFLTCYGHVINASGMCLFGANCCPVEALPEFLSAVMGPDYSMDRVLESGWRIATMRMSFNVREGIKPFQITLPGRMIGRPALQTGPLKEIVVDYKTQTKEYLQLMGWDPDTAEPLSDTLAKLDLDAVVR